MKMVVPITIDDDNMTTDAVAESYDEWAVDSSLSVFYPATSSQGVIGGANKRLWENPYTGDIYVSAVNSIYLQSAGKGNFSLFCTLPDFAIAGITDIAGDGSRDILYVVGYTDDTGDASQTDIYAVALSSAEISLWLENAGDDISALDVDDYTGELYTFAPGYVQRRLKTYSGVYGTVLYTDGSGYVTGGCVNPDTKDLWIANSTGGILLKALGVGTPALITGTDSYAWGYMSMNRVTLDVFGIVTSTNEIYYQDGGTGAFSLYEDTYSYDAVYASWRHNSEFLLLGASSSNIYVNSSKFFTTNDYIVYQDRVYYSLVNNIAVPPSSDNTVWFDYGATNPYRMFDGAISTPTTATGSINLTLDNDNITAIGFFGMTAQEIQVVLTVDTVEVYNETIELRSTEVGDWYEYFFNPINQVRDTVFENIPAYSSGDFVITISGASVSDAVEAGLMVPGYSYDVGNTKRGVKPGFVNYSTTEVDAFGRISITPRGSAKTLDCECFLDSRAQASAVIDLYNRTKDLNCLWIGSRDADTWSLIYGICKRFDATIEDNNGKYSLQILGVV